MSFGRTSRVDDGLVIKFAAVLVLIFAIVGLLVYLVSNDPRFSGRELPPPPLSPELLKLDDPKSVQLPAVQATLSDDLTLVSFPTELGQFYSIQSQIDRSKDGKESERVFIGTARGLVEYEEGQAPILHMRNVKVPMEWIVTLSVSPDLILTSSYASQSQTDGRDVGTYAFLRASQKWIRVSDQLLEHHGNGGRIVLVREDGFLDEPYLEDDILKFRPATGSPRIAYPNHRVRVVSDRLLVVERRGKLNVIADGIAKEVELERHGEIESLVFDEKFGYLSWVKRPIKGRRHGGSQTTEPLGITILDLDSLRSVSTLRSSDGGYLGALTLGLSEKSVWLGLMNGEQPLIRLDRDGLVAWLVKGVPPGYYLDTTSNSKRTVWLGICKDFYEPYRTNCYLGKSADVSGKPKWATQ